MSSKPVGRIEERLQSASPKIYQPRSCRSSTDGTIPDRSREAGSRQVIEKIALKRRDYLVGCGRY